MQNLHLRGRLVQLRITTVNDTNQGSPPRTLGAQHKTQIWTQLQGCDASVMIQSTTNNSVEKDFQDNLSLVGDGFDTIVKAKQVVENMCPKTMSSVDILAIATRDVIQLVGGPRNSVELGRRNGLISQASRVNGNLPKGSFNLVQLVSLFRSKGLSPTDMIALSTNKLFYLIIVIT
ncbi:hypothetical protein SUGI_1315110 [Cryptomeria japonica]|uniref:Plant heme peroxidase family profile domain-containing protein n=1 Tax=Cryptomeria japonica TaxID=3369 RepID=A0AAD3NRC7_CRYJA|nr:hypothetical protein SUGI_0184660 [Cryptomeria japonica]GLJ57328.1 hypothetical protein SUGI_1315110 [Cryptomeria japonica]